MIRGALFDLSGVLYVGDVRGEMARLVEESGCGYAFAVGDDAGLAACIRVLSGDPARVSRLGDAARALFDQRFERRLAMCAWRAVLAAAGRE